MRRINPLLLVGVVAAFAGACRDSVVAPAASSDAIATSSSAANGRGRGTTTTTVLATLQISPDGGTYHVGDFDVVIPAGAVCDPSTTAYGRRHWDDDCTPANRTVTVSVVAESRRNGVSVDFRPDLRFRPSAGWVTIQTPAYRQLLTSDAVRKLAPTSEYFRSFGIAYVPSGGGSRLDEVILNGDRSLVTHVDRNSGLVWRRVKHFSGYMISSGFACIPTMEDSECIPDPTDGDLTDGLTTSMGVSVSSLMSLESIFVLP